MVDCCAKSIAFAVKIRKRKSTGTCRKKRIKVEEDPPTKPTRSQQVRASQLREDEVQLQLKMPAKFEDISSDGNTARRSVVARDLGGQHYVQAQRYTIEDDIVISGISGRLPESSNIEEFRNNLFNGVDMVNNDDRRWPSGLFGLPDRLGKIKQEDMENFDPPFFGVHQKQAECMDPVLRMLLESTHEAIIDAGE